MKELIWQEISTKYTYPLRFSDECALEETLLHLRHTHVRHFEEALGNRPDLVEFPARRSRKDVLPHFRW